MIYDVLELLLNYMQFVSLIVLVAPSAFPPFYSSPFRLLDSALSSVSHGSGDVNSTSTRSPMSGFNFPAWMPPDLRSLFAFTSIVLPFGLSGLSVLVLGPLLFVFFTYSLCISVFTMVSGVLLLYAQRSAAIRDSGSALSRLVLSVPTQINIAMATAGGVSVILLLSIGFVWYHVARRRKRAQVLEQLRYLEHAPRAVEERAAEMLLGSNTTTRNEEDCDPPPSLQSQWGGDEARVCYAKAELAFREMQRRKHVETYARSPAWILLKLFALLISVAALLYLLWDGVWNNSESLPRGTMLYSIVGVLLLTALLLTVSLVLSFSEKGRRWLFSAKLWLRHLFIYFLMLFVSFLYAPILCNSISVIPCRDLHSNANLSSVKMLHGIQTGSGVRQIVWQRGLLADPNVPCAGVDGFMRASSLLTATAYTLFIIMLVGFVTRQVLLALEHYPLAKSRRHSLGCCEQGSKVETENGWPQRGFAARDAVSQPHGISDSLTTYYERVRLSANEVRFLYAPYTYSWRYFKLVVLVQKTAMVIFSQVMREDVGVLSPWTGFVALMLINLAMFAMLLLCRPYAETLEYVVSVALQLMLLVLASMGLVSFLEPVKIPEGLWSLVTSCVVLVPCAAVFVGNALTSKSQSCPTRWDTHKHFAKGRRRTVAGPRRWISVLRNLCAKSMCAEHLWCQRYGQEVFREQKFVPALYFVSNKGSVLMREVEPPRTAAFLVETLSEATKRIKTVSDDYKSQASSSPQTEVDFSSAYVYLRSLRKKLFSGRFESREGQSAALCSHPHVMGVAPLHVAGTPGNMSQGPLSAQHPAHFSEEFCSSSAPVSLGATGSSPTPTKWWLQSSKQNSAAASPMTSLVPIDPLSESTVGGHLRRPLATALFSSVRGAYDEPSTPNFCTRRVSLRTNTDRCVHYDNMTASLDGRPASPLFSQYHPSVSQHMRHQEAFFELVQAVTGRHRLVQYHREQKHHLERQQRAVDCYTNEQAASMVRRLLVFIVSTTAVAAAMFLRGILHVGEEGYSEHDGDNI
uniref:Uncharacterized protein n=1 Tax=Trypanosoma congolense (strain IL3000) TaxID=1068625 RepID=G0US23_TRYCI|nr:conserved hypothetical protein [Trypanosoma congolense IL3000]